jgi:hypothetical protein
VYFLYGYGRRNLEGVLDVVGAMQSLMKLWMGIVSTVYAQCVELAAF